MTPSPTSHNPVWNRSPLVRFFRWAFSGRILRRVVLGIAWTATLVALAYGIENWRARRAWNKYRAELESRGAILDLSAMIPPEIPDEQNLAATPFVQSWFRRELNWRSRWNDDYEVADVPRDNSSPASSARVPMDLARWAWSLNAAASNRAANPNFPHRKATPVPDATLQELYPSRKTAATAVLKGLESSGPHLEELRTASQRPEARYPVVYSLDNPWAILLPHLSALRGTGKRLQLRACARLATGDTSGALDDTRLQLRLADSLQNEPFLISLLVRMATIRDALQPVWEGLANRQWSDADLAALQERLSRIRLLPALDRALDSERASALRTADLLRERKIRIDDLLNDSGRESGDLVVDLRNLATRMAPRGWLDWEKLNYCLLRDRQVEGAFDVTANRVFPERIAANSREIAEQLGTSRTGRFSDEVAEDNGSKGASHFLRHRGLAAMLLPELKELPRKVAATQTAVDQALVACALERFRISSGTYPASLAQLVPKFLAQLPQDLVSGTPATYRQTPEGGYLLYSVGWDGRDDGGVAGTTPSSESSTGDWVWPGAIR